MRRYEPPDFLLFALIAFAAFLPLAFVDPAGQGLSLARDVRKLAEGPPNWLTVAGRAAGTALCMALPAAGLGWWLQGVVVRRGLRLTGRSDAPHQTDYDHTPADRPPPAPTDGPATVFVPLPDEGTDVWRPVVADPVGPMLFRLTGPVPDGEVWAFEPGTVVRCYERVFADGTRGLAAVEPAAP
jgi:hypothetical protein